MMIVRFLHFPTNTLRLIEKHIDYTYIHTKVYKRIIVNVIPSLFLRVMLLNTTYLNIHVDSSTLISWILIRNTCPRALPDTSSVQMELVRWAILRRGQENPYVTRDINPLHWSGSAPPPRTLYDPGFVFMARSFYI